MLISALYLEVKILRGLVLVQFKKDARFPCAQHFLQCWAPFHYIKHFKCINIKRLRLQSLKINISSPCKQFILYISMSGIL